MISWLKNYVVRLSEHVPSWVSWRLPVLLAVVLVVLIIPLPDVFAIPLGYVATKLLLLGVALAVLRPRRKRRELPSSPES
ncbi:MAG TPA: hypothetical protein VJL28_02375 [Gemmatimonadaceae bacterium]|nr:hypothetical protein [Gemmatimonadaceae bacterium]